MEGSAAHELAAHCLNMGFDAKRFLGRRIDVNGTCTATIFLAEGAPDAPGRYEVTPEMANHVQEYVRIVRRCANQKPPGELLVEQRVYATRIHPEDVHGTADAIVYREAEKTLHVFDLKYGRGVPVEAEGNPQLAIYACGAQMKYHNRGVNNVVMHIFQPRCPHRDGSHRKWSLESFYLDKWERELAAAVNAVGYAAEMHPTQDASVWGATNLEPGDHCRFCKAAATCPARAAMAIETAKTEFGDTAELTPPESMDLGELARVLHKARQIQHWIKAVEEHAHKLAKAGTPPTGFKLVVGRSTRAWSDEEKLKQFLPALTSIDTAELYEPAKLLSPAKLEKVLPKDEQAALAPFIVKRASGTLLVPDDDPRPAATPDAADEFGPSVEQ